MDTRNQLLSDAMALLRRAGVRIEAGSPTDLEIALPDGTRVLAHIKLSNRPTTWKERSDSHSSANRPVGRTLYITRRASPSLRARAHQADVDLLELDSGIIIFNGGAIHQEKVVQSVQKTRRAGSPPWTRWAIERIRILTDHPFQQRELADILGVTQQAVSHALKSHQPGSRKQHRQSASRDNLLNQFLAHYMGPGGLSTFWYGLDPVVQQANQALTFSNEMDVRALITGDTAADVYAPWQLPKAAHVYALEALDYTAVGFTPATRESHTLRITVPEDPTVWRTPSALNSPPNLADPVLVLWDLLNERTYNSEESASHLRRHILNWTIDA